MACGGMRVATLDGSDDSALCLEITRGDYAQEAMRGSARHDAYDALRGGQLGAYATHSKQARC